MICPNCGSKMIEKGDKFYCPFCQTTELKNINLKDEFVETAANSRDVFENSVSGVARIIRLDMPIQGSGFVISKNGLIVTNSHVVLGDADEIPSRVKVEINGNPHFAKVLKYNVDYRNEIDIALLLLEETSSIKPLRLGDSSKVHTGDEVILIGNPKAEGISVTKGIISDANRMLNGTHYFLSDVATNPGNSGGPLFNSNGEVIGVCVLKKKDAEGMNYFIPINDVKQILKCWGFKGDLL